MRHRVSIMIVFSLILFISGCGSKANMPDNPIIFSHSVENGYSVLANSGMEYVPFCDVSQDDIGDCIGYCDAPVKDAESVRHYIYTLRDYSSEEWIVEVDSENADSGLVYRERSVEYAPEGLMQEYNMEDEGIDDIAGEEENPGVTYVHENGVYVVDGDMVLEYKLDLTGRSPNAAYDTTYTVLSNNPDITFEEVDRSQYSSNSDDWLHGTIIIGIQTIDKDGNIIKASWIPEYNRES